MAGVNPQAITDQNKQLGIRWFDEVWNKGRREVIHEMLTKDCIIHDGAVKFRGPEEFARFHDGLQAAFTNFKMNPIVSLAEGDLISIYWSAESIHRETGKAVRVTGITVARVKDGKFVEAWQSWDKIGLMAQVPGVKLA
jgi:predicted SnoaL-like aldol condensation-catalyzing enzyme